MKKRNQRALLCLLSAMGFSILAGGSVMAAEDGEIRDKITIPYEQENAWDKVAMINDDAVDTGVNIRATADKDGEVVGYLYYGMAAWVIDKGDEWTEITSGDITGFVKNDYLLYGRDVIGLADHYGYEGVATTWDDVKLFSAENADSDVMDVLETGAYFILLQDEGHWLTVQVGTDGLGYVSSEDVSKVLILDTAVDKDELYEGNDLVPMNRETEADTEETEETEETDPAETETPETTAPETSTPETDWQQPETSAPETNPPQTETSAPETNPPQTETSAPETNPPQTETSAPETNPPQTETSAPETNPPQTETSDPGSGDNGGWYDADTDTYYDANGNVIGKKNNSPAPETPETNGETTPETSAPDDGTDESGEDGWYDADSDTYYDADGNVIDNDYEAASYAENSEAGEVTSDDIGLLAALIYCEAGSDDYDSMLAMGQMVMDCVYSTEYPDTVSEVIYQSGLFASPSNGALSDALVGGVPSACYEAAAAVMA